MRSLARFWERQLSSLCSYCSSWRCVKIGRSLNSQPLILIFQPRQAKGFHNMNNPDFVSPGSRFRRRQKLPGYGSVSLRLESTRVVSYRRYVAFESQIKAESSGSSTYSRGLPPTGIRESPIATSARDADRYFAYPFLTEDSQRVRNAGPNRLE